MGFGGEEELPLYNDQCFVRIRLEADMIVCVHDKVLPLVHQVRLAPKDKEPRRVRVHAYACLSP